MSKWTTLSPNLVGAASYYLDTVEEIKAMSLTCKSWQSGQLPEPLARAQFHHSTKWARSFADARPHNQRWTAFVEHRKMVDQRRQNQRGAYVPFNVGECQNVVTTPSFLWVCDPGQDKIISMNAQGIVRSRLAKTSPCASDGGNLSIDCVYDFEYGCGALRPVPLPYIGSDLSVRVFDSTSGRCLKQTKLAIVAHTTLVAQYVDVSSRTISLLTRVDGNRYELHWCSFSDLASDGGFLLGDWQSLELDVRANAFQHVLGFAFNLKRGSLVLFVSSASTLLANGHPRPKFRHVGDIGQIVRIDVDTAARPTSMCTAVCAIFDTQDNDFSWFRVDWSDDIIVLGNNERLLQVDLPSLRVRAQSVQDSYCNSCDCAIDCNSATVTRLFKCRSTLMELNWEARYGSDYSLRWTVYSPLQRHDDVQQIEEEQIETDFDLGEESKEKQEDALENKHEELCDNDNDAVELERQFPFQRSRLWRCKLPDCRGGKGEGMRVWVQPDWTAIYWARGLLHIFNFGASESACVDLEPHTLQMHTMLRRDALEEVKVSDEKSDVEGCPLSSESTIHSATPFVLSTALQMQTCAQELGAEVSATYTVVDTVPRMCVCGPPSDGIGIHQLRLQEAAAMSSLSDRVSSTSPLVSPWGIKAIPQNPAISGEKTALDAFSHVVRGPRNRQGNCWMNSIVVLILTLPKVRHALLNLQLDANKLNAPTNPEHALTLAVAQLARTLCNNKHDRRSSLRKKIVRATERIRNAFADLGFSRGQGHDVLHALQTLTRSLTGSLTLPVTPSLVEVGDSSAAFVAVEQVGLDEKGEPVWHAAVLAPSEEGWWLFDDTLGSTKSNFQGGLLRPGAAGAVVEHYAKIACVCVHMA